MSLPLLQVAADADLGVLLEHRDREVAVGLLQPAPAITTSHSIDSRSIVVMRRRATGAAPG